MALLNETMILELEQRAELAAEALEDPEVCRRYAAKAAKGDVPALIEALREAYNDGGGGGDLGMLLRNALKERILRAAQTLDEGSKRIATLSEDVKIHSMNVAAIRNEGRVIVDVRLMVGDEPVLK
jgi:hypothetical protein